MGKGLQGRHVVIWQVLEGSHAQELIPADCNHIELQVTHQGSGHLSLLTLVASSVIHALPFLWEQL